MSEQKEMTGYPSIDKPWMQYYSEEARNVSMPDCSMYDLLIMSGKNHQTAVAMDYYGTRITYSLFFEWIDKCANFFIEEGIQKGEKVSILTPNFPETFMVIYALNKLGAVANLIDPRNNVDRIEKYISDANSTRVVLLDIVFPKTKELFIKLSIQRVYVIAAETFLPVPVRMVKNY